MRTLPEEAKFAKFFLDVADGVLNDDNHNLIIPGRCLAIKDSDIVIYHLWKFDETSVMKN